MAMVLVRFILTSAVVLTVAWLVVVAIGVIAS